MSGLSGILSPIDKIDEADELLLEIGKLISSLNRDLKPQKAVQKQQTL